MHPPAGMNSEFEGGFGFAHAWSKSARLVSTPGFSSSHPGRVALFERGRCDFKPERFVPTDIPIVDSEGGPTSFTILGTGLAQVTEVLVNDVATYFSAESDSIEVFAPSLDLGPLSITVVAPDQSATLTAHGVHPVPAVLELKLGAPLEPTTEVITLGEPGHELWLLASLSPEPTLLPSPFPSLAIGGSGSLILVDALTIPSSGEASTHLTLEFAPPVNFVKFYLQAIELGVTRPRLPVTTNRIELSVIL